MKSKSRIRVGARGRKTDILIRYHGRRSSAFLPENPCSLGAFGAHLIDRKLVRAFLDQGYRVDMAMSGPMVMERAIVGRPDVIVMKHILAHMNGDAVARMLQEMPNTAQTPVILYDQSGDMDTRDRLMAPRLSNVKDVVTHDTASVVAAAKRVLDQLR